MIDLYNRDCLEVMYDLMNKGVKVDCIITDPPYGMSFQSNHRKLKHKVIANDNSLEWLYEFVYLSHALLKEDSHMYAFCSFHHVDKFKQAFEQYFDVKNILIWVKNNTGMGDLYGDYAPQYEMCIFATKGRRLINGARPSNILKSKKTGNVLHPTQKPIDLIEFLVSKSSNANDTILDPFMGSGTTGLAAKNYDRNFIGIELDEDYFNIASKRINETQVQERLF